VSPKNRAWNFFALPPESRPAHKVQVAETASGCTGCSYEIVSGRTLWKVYGPDLNGRFGGLQGTGGLEAVILDATGTTTGVINDQFGNGVATVSGGTVTWNTTRVGAYGPLPGVQAQTLTDVSQLAAATAWRSRRIDPTGFYWLGARNYEPTSGRFLSADPMGHAASPSLYDFCNGDPVNSFDPTGRCKSDSLGKLQDSIDNFGASQTDIFAGLNAVNRFNAQNSGSNDGTNTSLIGTIWNGVSDFFSPGVNELLRPIGSFSESYGSFRDGLEKANTDFNCPVPPGFLGAGLDTLAMAFGDALFATKAAPVIAAETAAVKPGSFSVIDWTGYPEYLPKPTGSVNLVEGAEYTAARRAADVTNNGLREGFGLRGVEVDIHEIQPVKFGGSPTDPLNKMLLPRDLHRQVVTPFWNQLQQDVSPFIYRPPGT
jgi:RHS repeat-associated protein